MSFPLYNNLFKLKQDVLSTVRVEHKRSRNLSSLLHQTLDRVNVLGDDDSYGHTGCVNALSWAQNGEVLLSGGDDTTVRLWKMDPSDTAQEYPFVCRSVIHTGHTANIFNAQLLPYSTHLVTVAGDKQVRVSDIAMALTSDGVETRYTTRDCLKDVLRCHSDRVKRIVTEDSPALFLTVSEDGSIRQHDLRTPHICRQPGTSCPAPLLKLNHDLSTVSLSTLTPYQFVVAGESPYGYLFDRRNIGRRLEEEWGVPSSTDEVTTCVRRFGRPRREKKKYRRDNVTGSRMSNYNGHEVLLSYNGDAVYLFSTLDAPCDTQPSSTFAADSNTRATKTPESKSNSGSKIEPDQDVLLDGVSMGSEDDQEEEDEETDQDELEDEEYAELESNYFPSIPTIMPIRRYVGARNVETVKDVNFIGPNDELVVSGSDDGNFFVWDKSSGELEGVYEGDGSVVNVIEGHPSLPLLAVSGIDTTVKLFAPSRGPSQFSRIENKEKIMEANRRPVQSFDLRVLLAEAMIRSGPSTECIHQ